MRKVASMVLAFCMVASLATGCSKGANNADPKTSATVAPTKKEPVVVKMFLPTSGKLGDTTNPIGDYITEKTGVKLDIIAVPTSNSKEKLSLTLASGEIPDILRLGWNEYLQYAESGAFAALDDKIKNYPNLNKYFTEDMRPRLKVSDGKVYGVPSINTEGKWNLYIRKDWLDNLKLPIPKTTDEYYNTMKAFTENDPDGNGKNDTVGYTSGTLHALVGAFGVGMGIYTMEGDKISTNTISQNYKKALQYINKLYKDKYIDPEAFNMKTEQVTEKIVNGKAGSYTGWWSDGATHMYANKMKEKNPKADLVAIDAITGPDGKGGMPQVEPIESVWSVSTKSKYVNEIMGLFDFMVTDQGYRTGRYGLENLHWKQENGKVTWIASQAADKKDSKGNAIDVADVSMYYMFQRVDLYPEYFTTTNSEMDKLSAFNFAKASNIKIIKNVFMGITTKELTDKSPEVYKYENDMRLKFILGQEPFENWDKYAENWKKLGGEEMRQSMLKVYNKQTGKNYTFLEP
jgi:putative aldouronate transport system substrate-binding protein